MAESASQQIARLTRERDQLKDAGHELEDNLRVLASILRHSTLHRQVPIQIENAEEARSAWRRVA